MTLPTLVTPTYQIKLPVSGIELGYRPFLVKEEKILMIASEAKDEQQILTLDKDFSKKVEECAKEKEIGYMDAVLHLCEENEIEPDTVSKFLTKPIKEKIEREARGLNLLPTKTELPFS